MPAWRRTIVLAVGLMALSTSAAPAVARSADSLFGVNYTFRTTLDRSDADRMARAGVPGVRWTLYWAQIEARRDRFDWRVADGLIGTLAARGIRSLPMVYGSPRWAVGGRRGLTFVTGWPVYLGGSAARPPVGSAEAENAWTGFLRQAVRRYGPGGEYWKGPFKHRHPSLRPLPVRTWQIWNEPNLKETFQPAPSVQRYARLVELAHRAITRADPRAHVSLAGMPGLVEFPGWAYLDQLYQVPGIERAFDEVAFHPYSTDLKSLRFQVKQVRTVMRLHHDAATPLWLSEMGWGSAAPDGHLNVGLEGQGRLLSQSFKLLRRRSEAWNINRVDWFDWRDPGNYSGDCAWCPHAGLLQPDGSAKPAWRAYQRSTP
jgi:hypothetical protein